MSQDWSPLALARELVRIPSESSSPVASDAAAPERRVADCLLAHCARLGLEHALHEAAPGRWNVAARLPRPGAPRVLIAGHLDTVSAQGMATPFAGELDAGRDLLGRGACDDKGPLAAALAAIARCLAEGRRPAVDLTLLGTADEEAGMAGARAWAATGGTADLVLVLEPTGLRPVAAHKGVYRCRLDATGRACHSSLPHLGSNALEPLLAAVERVRQLAGAWDRHEDALLGRPTITLTGLGGGSAINVVPASGLATFDARLVPGMDPAEAEAAVRGCCPAQVALTTLFTAPALAARTAEHGLDQRLAAALAAVGADPASTGAPWCSDAAFLQRLGPCRVWGPGRIELAHTPDERIAIEELDRAAEALYGFLAADG